MLWQITHWSHIDHTSWICTENTFLYTDVCSVEKCTGFFIIDNIKWIPVWLLECNQHTMIYHSHLFNIAQHYLSVSYLPLDFEATQLLRSNKGWTSWYKSTIQNNRWVFTLLSGKLDWYIMNNFKMTIYTNRQNSFHSFSVCQAIVAKVLISRTDQSTHMHIVFNTSWAVTGTLSLLP